MCIRDRLYIYCQHPYQLHTTQLTNFHFTRHIHLCTTYYHHCTQVKHKHYIRMFRVKRQRRWLISKSSFSRQCVGRIRDTCSQLTWKSHSTHTHRTYWHRGTFWPTLTPAQTLYLHESCQNKHKSKVWKMATSPFDVRFASSSCSQLTRNLQTDTHTYYWSSTDWKFHLLFPT